MIANVILSLGWLLLTGLLIYVSAYMFSLGQGLLNAFQLTMVALMLLGWVLLWTGHADWAGRIAGLQILLAVVLYVVYL